MRRGLDSATPPDASQVAAARAAGISIWSGYLASQANVGLLRAWTKAEFDTARGCGDTPIAFCSGWDSPSACRNLALAWNVRLCLDVESGIRADGSWVQAWLDASGAGLYGNSGVFLARKAPFFILAGYYGDDPHATWRGNPPSVPHGYQWQGTHDEFGVAVDSTYFDDWFGTQGDDMTPDDIQALKEAFFRLGYIDIRDDEPSGGELTNWLNDGHTTMRGAVGDLVGILDSAEGQAFRAQFRAILDAGPAKPPSSGGGASTTHHHDTVVDDATGHPVTISSGPPQG